MTGIVYRSTGSWYDVKTIEGQFLKARIKGVVKIEGRSSTNPIAVGDEVVMEWENESQGIATIISIGDRHNYISRQSPGNRRQHHIVASNMDQAMIIATLRSPRTSSGFIDRFLVAAESYHIPAIILINKKDTWKQVDHLQYEEWVATYSAIGYRVIAISVLQNQGLDEVIQLLKDKTTLISGHSGVGKSSLLNALAPEIDLHTQEVSEWSGKGMHTTTFAEMFDLPFGAKVIDTPGIREFGIVDVDREELGQYFPEMRAVMKDCQYNNCQHVSEPGCAVKKAVEDGRISPERLGSYWNILDSMPTNHWE